MSKARKSPGGSHVTKPVVLRREWSWVLMLPQDQVKQPINSQQCRRPVTTCAGPFFIVVHQRGGRRGLWIQSDTKPMHILSAAPDELCFMSAEMPCRNFLPFDAEQSVSLDWWNQMLKNTAAFMKKLFFWTRAAAICVQRLAESHEMVSFISRQLACLFHVMNYIFSRPVRINHHCQCYGSLIS